MARVASTSSAVSLPRFRSSYLHSHLQPPRFVNFSLHAQKENLRHHRIFCRNNSDSVDSAATEVKQVQLWLLGSIFRLANDKQFAQEKPVAVPKSGIDAAATETSPSAGTGFPDYPTKDLNRRVALGSILSAVGFFVSRRLDFGSVSLKDLSAAALPYEEALANGKPTVVEFYADWCEVCRELAPDVYKVEQQYKDKVNFVMLNVDNTKWEQELDEFGVEGIPHFAFLDKEGNEEGNVVGRLPRQYLLENVDALARGEPNVPHARVVGQFSKAEARKVHAVVDPRSHG